MNKEEQITINKLKDLAELTFSNNLIMYSDFLNLYEQMLFLTNKNSFPQVNYEYIGGYQEAERKILRFYTDTSCINDEAPFSCLIMSPLNEKYSDSLTHRDFLGSLLGLGINRGKVGDIIVEENRAFVFVKTSLVKFIIDNLRKVKHTIIYCEEVDFPSDYQLKGFDIVNGTVSSIRLDAVTALAFRLSRGKIAEVIAGGKVFINSKQTLSSSASMKEGDIVSLKGMGRYLFYQINTTTKKGRLSITIKRYT